MRKIKIPVISVLLVFVLYSCGKIQTLPNIPHIEFTNFQIFDTVDILGNTAKCGRLKFYFEDGDGNIGLPSPVEGQTQDSINLFFTLYRTKDGAEILAPADDPLKPSNYRIPFMEKTGQNTILRGTISVTFLYLFYSSGDTIRYEFFLKDRAENSSNTASTGKIAVFVNGNYNK